MNNLYRELAPVSAAAWAGIEEEARRTFALHAAARKAVDVTGPDGLALAGLGTGHVTAIDAPADGVIGGAARLAAGRRAARAVHGSTARRSTPSSAARSTRTGSR